MADIARALRITVDLDSGLVPRPQIPILMQGDKQADRVIVSVVRDGQPVDLSGVSASASFIRASGDEVPVAGTVAGSEAEITLIEHCYAETGPYELHVRLQIGDERRTVLLITGRVRQKSNGRIINVENVIPSIDDILAQLDVMRAVTESTENAAQGARDAAEDATEQAQAAMAAAQEAENAADSAAEQAQAASAAAQSATAAAQKINQMAATAQGLPENSTPTATVTDDGTGLLLTLGIPEGKTGATGATPVLSFVISTGAPGTDAEVTEITGTPEAPVIHLKIPRGDTGEIENMPFSAIDPQPLGDTPSAGQSEYVSRGDHVHPLPTAQEVGARPDTWTPTAQEVGARPATWMPTAQEVGARPDTWTPTAEEVGARPDTWTPAHQWTATLPASGWSTGSAPYTQTVEVADILATDAPIIDIDMSGATVDTAQALQAAWALVGRIVCGDGQITATCYEQAPETDLTLTILAIR